MAKQTKEEKAKLAKAKLELKAKKAKEKADAKAKKAKVRLVKHVITQEDLDNNPELIAQGVQIGETIELPVTDEPFHIKVSMNDEVYEADTNNIAETLLSLKPNQFKTKVIIDVTFFDRSAQFVLFNQKAKRTFTHPLAAQFFDKNVRLALNAR